MSGVRRPAAYYLGEMDGPTLPFDAIPGFAYQAPFFGGFPNGQSDTSSQDQDITQGYAVDNAAESEARQVFVGNLSYSTSWQDLKDFLRAAGEVRMRRPARF